MVKRSSITFTALKPPKPPTLEERLKYSAESVARDAVETAPAVKKLRDEITAAVFKATKAALKKHRV